MILRCLVLYLFEFFEKEDKAITHLSTRFALQLCYLIIREKCRFQSSNFARVDFCLGNYHTFNKFRIPHLDKLFYWDYKMLQRQCLNTVPPVAGSLISKEAN